jgi:ketosteroid isomerase-like protein
MTINTVPANDRAVVERYMALMQAGGGGVDDLVSLFTEDAVYVEPFMGQPTVHQGKSEIRDFYQHALESDMRAARLTLDRLDMDGERLRSEWTCEIAAMPGPMRGFDLLTLRDGRIARLETTVTQAPPMPPR